MDPVADTNDMVIPGREGTGAGASKRARAGGIQQMMQEQYGAQGWPFRRYAVPVQAAQMIARKGRSMQMLSSKGNQYELL